MKSGLKFTNLRPEHAAIIDRWSAEWKIRTTSQTVVRMVEEFDRQNERLEQAEKSLNMILDRMHDRAEVVAQMDRADQDLANIERELVAITKQVQRNPRQLRLD